MVPQYETGNSVKWPRVHSLIHSNVSLTPENYDQRPHLLDIFERKEQVSRPSQPGTWQCLHPQDNSGTVAEKIPLLSSSLLQPLWVFFFFFKLHTQTKKCGFGLVIFWISTSWDDLCWQAWSVFLAFLNSPRQSRDISVRFHRFIILLMFVQGYKKKKSTD